MYRYTPADLRSLGLVKALLSCLSRWHSREVMPTAARMGALPPKKQGWTYYLRKYKNKMKWISQQVWISYYLYDLLLYDLLIHPLSFNQVMLHQSSAHAIHGWLTLTLRLKLTCRSVSECDKNVPEKALHHAAKRCVRAASFTTGGLVLDPKKSAASASGWDGPWR